MADNHLTDQLSGLFSDLKGVDNIKETSEASSPLRRLQQDTGRILSSFEDDPFSIELQTIAAISDLTATVFNLDELLKLIVDLIKSNFKLYHVQVYFLDENSESPMLVPVAGSGEIGQQIQERGYALPLHDERALAARAARNKQEELDNNLYADLNFTPDPLLLRVRAELAVPLMVFDEVIGALDIYADKPGFFNPQSLLTYTALASQIVVAEQNTRLLRGAEKQAMRLTMLNEMGQALSAAATLDDMFKVAVRYAPQIVHANQSDIALLTDAGDSLDVFTLQEEAGAVPVGMQLPLQGTAMGKAVQERTVINIPNLFKSDFTDARRLAEQGLHSALIAPLSTGDQVIGTLSVCSKTQQPYTLRDENLFLHIATFLGSTIESKRLFEQTQEVLSATERLYSVSQRINMADDLKDILAAIAEGLPVAGINRALLFTFEYDLAGEIEAATIAANWHNGDGTPPLPVGERYPRAMFTAIGPFLGAEATFIADAQQSEKIDANALFMIEQQNIRALAALPLWVGARQLGAIALQGETAHHFSQREIQSYLSVAPQIASAVENGRLLIETRAILSENEETQKRYTVQSWEHYLSGSGQNTLGYEQVREGVMPMGDELPPEINLAVSQAQTIVIDASGYDDLAADANGRPSLIIPLTLRDEVIGVLGMQDIEASHSWLPEEIAMVEAIATQFSQVAEELRLLDETQQRAAREQLTRQITDKVHAASSVEDALQITVEELSKALGQAHTFVNLELEKEPEQ